MTDDRFPLGGRRGSRHAHETSAVSRPPAQYVELHAHSAYSFLDGASLPDELAVAAHGFGYGALALTDHDGLHGAMELA